MKLNAAEIIAKHLLRENLIVFDETKDGNLIIMNACVYVVDAKKLKEVVKNENL